MGWGYVQLDTYLDLHLSPVVHASISMLASPEDLEEFEGSIGMLFNPVSLLSFAASVATTHINAYTRIRPQLLSQQRLSLIVIKHRGAYYEQPPNNAYGNF